MSAKTRRLEDLFILVGRKLNWSFVKLTYHIEWCHAIVRDGFYDRVRTMLENVLVRP